MFYSSRNEVMFAWKNGLTFCSNIHKKCMIVAMLVFKQASRHRMGFYSVSNHMSS